MAWLNTAPRDDTKAALSGASKEEPLTRLKQMEADGIDPMMPPLSAPSYIEYLLELGPTEAAGSGAGAISWRMLSAWQENTSIILSPWEARLLRDLSGAWLVEAERARKPDCPAPWIGEVHELNRDAIARKVSAAFSGFARRASSRA